MKIFNSNQIQIEDDNEKENNETLKKLKESKSQKPVIRIEHNLLIKENK